MLGNIVNTAAVIFGSLLGMWLKKGIPDRIKDIIMTSMGLSILALGIKDGINFNNGMLIILFMVIGGIIGELLRIDERLTLLGVYLEKKFSKNGSNDIVKGFVTTSIMFNVGAMAIVGSIKSGLSGNNEILFIKALLDGVASLIFSSKYGIGVLFSAIIVFIYQGSIFLFAFFIKSGLDDVIINQISVVGGLMMIGLGVNLLFNKNIKIGNLMPALFIPIIYKAIVSFF